MNDRLIGILGGGQLGRMLALAGYPLGLRFRFLDPASDAPVRYLAEHIVAPYEDHLAVAQFGAGLTVATYEFENVPVATARALEQRVPVFPPPQALEVAQDRLAEKRFFTQLHIPTAPFEPVDDRTSLDTAIARIGLPAVLKTRRLGYDGKGQALIRQHTDIDDAWRALGGQPLILEGFVSFVRELSILAVRGRDGAIAYYPLVENLHRNGILYRSIAPAPSLTTDVQMLAETYARRVLEALDYVGVLAIEMFEVDASSVGATGVRLLANEMAPRVHNSGHWTIEGAVTSQFENHLRAITGLPLGDTSARGCAAMVNLIGSLPDAEMLLALPDTHLHLYDKAPRPGRKLGHVTVCAGDATRLAERLALVERYVPARTQ
ncbi:MAG: 5-(carboxyamino)imidazole ribonucleotide synthase [Roseiflexus sp.]|nr:5-(carboxyamino)imidazole ribonucleotide synthase [Roseiflexus sp.]MCS7287530.1 5-(carboxyamino)imidazole ribonucleotide synthase [Roseiflexus sp.]MDW8148599.1 5-(carboxyamino)imidazole ribonucleotide synthase [Roseiflexaceae bacterium]MDW8231751.1 5-(carboxyamino)imidazole ribonucleotide synthase [Roseiflexaceae bacterium]